MAENDSMTEPSTLTWKFWAATGLVILAILAIFIFLVRGNTSKTTGADQALGTQAFDQAKQRYDKGQFKAAISLLKTYLSEDRPDAAPAHILLGSAYEMTGASDKALEEYERAIGLQEDDPSVRYRYGILLRRLGRANKAIVQLSTAVKLDDQNGLFLSELAKTYSMQGRYLSAIRNWEKALKVYNGNAKVQATILLETGDAYTAIGETASARDAYRRGLDLEPDNTYLQSKLKSED